MSVKAGQPYAPDIREELTAMYLTDHKSLVTAADAAGFPRYRGNPARNGPGVGDIAGSDLPYALSGTP